MSRIKHEALRIAEKLTEMEQKRNEENNMAKEKHEEAAHTTAKKGKGQKKSAKGSPKRGQTPNTLSGRNQATPGNRNSATAGVRNQATPTKIKSAQDILEGLVRNTRLH